MVARVIMVVVTIRPALLMPVSIAMVTALLLIGRTYYAAPVVTFQRRLAELRRFRVISSFGDRTVVWWIRSRWREAFGTRQCDQLKNQAISNNQLRKSSHTPVNSPQSELTGRRALFRLEDLLALTALPRDLTVKIIANDRGSPCRLSACG